MSFVNGNFTITTTGTQTVNLGIQPIGMRIRVSSKSGTTEAYLHESNGTVDNTGYVTMVSRFLDGTSTQQFCVVGSSAKIISHWERISGTLTEVIAATFNSFTTTGFKLNINTAGSTAVNYSVYVEAWT